MWDSQDRIRSFWTRKKDLQDEVDLCHAFIILKGLRSESIAYRESECGWKTRRIQSSRLEKD
ncbi:hypothetical protein HID58_079773 [Brassica napus]|uniref:Uncharacterized protein n=1 Tax=Brassica napus TaxID=3708 RepID=A0ABQ7Y2Z3_BRANA|nr:hypothetical protein HID58_079773 [Brassica napus]